MSSTNSSSSLGRKLETMTHPAWHDDLNTASKTIQPIIFDPFTLRQRADYIRAVKSHSHKPDVWRKFLLSLNNDRRNYLRNHPSDTSHHLRMYQTLHKLYDLAISIIPMSASNRHSSEYTQLWLDLSALRAEDDLEEATALFKRMKSFRIGQDFPQFWNAWANLETSLHNHERASKFREVASSRANGDIPSTPVPTSANTLAAKRKLPLRPPRRIGPSVVTEGERKPKEGSDVRKPAPESLHESALQNARQTNSPMLWKMSPAPESNTESTKLDPSSSHKGNSPEVLRSSAREHAKEDIPQIFASPHEVEALRRKERITDVDEKIVCRGNVDELRFQDKPMNLEDFRKQRFDHRTELGTEQTPMKEMMEREHAQSMGLRTPVEEQTKVAASISSGSRNVNQTEYQRRKDYGLGSSLESHQSSRFAQAEVGLNTQEQGNASDGGILKNPDSLSKDLGYRHTPGGVSSRTKEWNSVQNDRLHQYGSELVRIRNTTDRIHSQQYDGEVERKPATATFSKSEKMYHNLRGNFGTGSEVSRDGSVRPEHTGTSTATGRKVVHKRGTAEREVMDNGFPGSETGYKEGQLQRRNLRSEMHSERPYTIGRRQLESSPASGAKGIEGDKRNEQTALETGPYVSPQVRYHNKCDQNRVSERRPQHEHYQSFDPDRKNITNTEKRGELERLNGNYEELVSRGKWGNHGERDKGGPPSVLRSSEPKSTGESNNPLFSSRHGFSPVSRGSPMSFSSRHGKHAGNAEENEKSQATLGDVRHGRIVQFLNGIRPDSLVTVNRRPYLILEMVGKGGSSKVFKVLSQDMRILALKRVKVPFGSTNFDATIDSYANEIGLLKKLRGSPTIIELFDAEVQREKGMIQLIMEYGDIDLARLLLRGKGRTINDNFRRMYWQQMLEAVHTIHEARIIHGDLKPANFLIVGGTLKLIDFGIAKAIVADDTTKVVRDTQVGTPNYMSPEALMCDEDDEEGESHEGYEAESDHRSGEERSSGTARRYRVGRGSDIWSLGCILYQMVYGRAPFAHIRNVMHKLACIQNPDFEIVYKKVDNKLVMDVLRGCLQRNPERRMSIPELLQHDFVRGGGGDGGKAGEGGMDESAGLSTSCDVRLAIYKVFELLRKQGYEKVVIEGETVHLAKGDEMFEKVVSGLVRELNDGKKTGQGGCAGGVTETGLREERNGKGLRTPTATAVTNSGGVIKQYN